LNSKGFSLLETVVFIVLAAIVIPIFYLTTQPVIKDMMTPTSWIKARFVAEKKMEEFMAYTFGDTRLAPTSVGTAAVTADTAFPTTDYAGYQWQWGINYLDCDNPSIPTGSPRCVGHTGTALITVPNPPAYATNYKQIDVTVRGPQGVSYRATSAVTARW
jgi:hypothetical protein